MTSDHRLSLFEFLHAADRLLWSYRSAIDRNARARLTPDDLLLNDFCARAASRARCLLDDDLARRSHGRGSVPHPGAAPGCGDAILGGSDGEGGETADSGGGRGRAHARRSHGAGMNKLHAVIQARRTAEAQRDAAAASARKSASIGASNETHPENSEREEPVSLQGSDERPLGEGWQLGPDPFETDPRAISAGGDLPVGPQNGSNNPAATASLTKSGSGSGWDSNPLRRRAPR
jgi:hypothetical protein